MLKVLLMDYYEFEREKAKHLLKTFGEFEFLEITSHKNFLESQELLTDFSLIILDLSFPTEKEGFEIVNLLRANAHLSKTPIIVLARSNNVELRNYALSLGVNDYISKPYTKERLEKSIRSLINVVLPSTYVLSNTSIIAIPVEKYIHRELKLASRSKHPLTLLLITPNETRADSDESLHNAVRDIVYHIVSDKLKNVVRITDSVILNNNRDILILLPCTDSDSVLPVFEKIKANITEGLRKLGLTFDDYFAYDYSTFPQDGKDVNSLLTNVWKKITSKFMLDKFSAIDKDTINFAKSRYESYKKKS